ncbi:hypothetical protein N7466_001461 [Penicillium verhagenii]|uniref:uncharacterized protein n=1 Tax=Penicillium verhagenii TaxID=1562060 RepID=UPI00254576CF|nr:uncharacterized protein N7466_001461 [Penicillium verhagenii]KAJ5938327.1 hypothetical protein N7466_001461 [Penicillium verhagenii]
MADAAELTLFDPQVEISQSLCNLTRSDSGLDLDLASLWDEFSDAPAIPPSPTTREILSTEPSMLIHSNHHSEIEYIFYSIPESNHGFYWLGPDPLAPQTYGDDIFLYISAFPFLGELVWVEFQLCRVSLVTGDVVDRNIFYLPRQESILGNLSQIRRQIREHISSYDHETATGLCRLRLYMYPRYGLLPIYRSRGIVSSAGMSDGAALDPTFFVQNMSANFEKDCQCIRNTG